MVQNLNIGVGVIILFRLGLRYPLVFYINPVDMERGTASVSAFAARST